MNNEREYMIILLISIPIASILIIIAINYLFNMSKDKNPYTLIESVEALKKLIISGENEYFISLGGGIARSSKIINLIDDKFSITNEIDGTHQMLSEEELFTESNIGKAITNKAFYAY